MKTLLMDLYLVIIIFLYYCYYLKTFLEHFQTKKSTFQAEELFLPLNEILVSYSNSPPICSVCAIFLMMQSQLCVCKPFTIIQKRVRAETLKLNTVHLFVQMDHFCLQWQIPVKVCQSGRFFTSLQTKLNMIATE